MKVTELEIPGVLLIQPKVFRDERGSFSETWQAERYRQAGITIPFVQDNLSRSEQGVLRGLHFQNPEAQAKLVSVAAGCVFDVVIDVRIGSPTFAKWVAVELSEKLRQQLFVPEGCAHGFYALTDAVFFYKCTASYSPTTEIGIRYDDPDLAIPWPVDTPRLSAKDRALPRLAQIPRHSLPRYEG